MSWRSDEGLELLFGLCYPKSSGNKLWPGWKVMLWEEADHRETRMTVGKECKTELLPCAWPGGGTPEASVSFYRPFFSCLLLSQTSPFKVKFSQARSLPTYDFFRVVWAKSSVSFETTRREENVLFTLQSNSCALLFVSIPGSPLRGESWWQSLSTDFMTGLYLKDLRWLFWCCCSRIMSQSAESLFSKGSFSTIV